VIALEPVFGVVLVEPFGNEGDLALVLRRYSHQCRARTRGLGLEVAEQRATTTVAADLLLVKPV
jgi:hypothetical protein